MFKPLRYNDSDVRRILIGNSQTLSQGEVIIPAVTTNIKNAATGGSTTGRLLGVVLSVVGKDGKVLEVNSYAAASDNITVDQVQVAYLPLHLRDTEFVANLTAAPATTNTSAFGNYAVDSTGLLLDETSYVVFGTTSNKQAFSYGLTGNSTTEVTCVFFATIAS